MNIDDYKKLNNKYVIGADECGFGSVSGPVFVAGVRAEKDWFIPGLNDSKKLSDKQRRIMDEKLRSNKDIVFAIHSIDNEAIDNFGITWALKECYRQVSEQLYQDGDLIIIDGSLNFDEILAGKKYKTMVKADTLIATVMAGSILGKVAHDDQLLKLHEEFPQYDWQSNNGYGSPAHIAAIKQFGFSKYHRKSYKIKGINK